MAKEDTPCPETVVWFRRDLRLSDNPALEAAVASGGPVVAAWVHAPVGGWDSAPGAAARVFLHRRPPVPRGVAPSPGKPSRPAAGPTIKALIDLARETGADAVYANGVAGSPRSSPGTRTAIAALRANGLDARLFDDGVLFRPDATKTIAGGPFPGLHAVLATMPVVSGPRGGRRPAPGRIPAPGPLPPSAASRNSGFALPSPGTPGSASPGRRARRRPGIAYPDFWTTRWRRIPATATGRTATGRPALPDLHFGCVSARQAWHAVQSRAATDRRAGTARGAEAFLRQLAWREFAHHLLFHFPATVHAPLRAEFTDFPWRDDPAALVAWQKGRTGYPLVDAGMRQLWKTGWMHNRVRMVVASFLVKDLLLPWRKGAAWFFDTLVDADLANNTFGWQWVAGCGADASPYFRVFNPTLQGGKFDPGGDYVRKWVPELARLPDRWIHRPWEAPASVLSGAGVAPGTTYPRPIVDHAAARLRALAALPRRGR